MDRFFEFAANHWELVSLFVGLLIALIVVERQRGARAISPQQVVMKLNREEAVVLDIRDKKDLAEGRIGDSIHIPYTAVKDRLSELEKYREKGIVIVDKIGQHSGTVAKVLKQAGFTQVERMSGGIAEWKNAGLPLKKK